MAVYSILSFVYREAPSNCLAEVQLRYGAKSAEVGGRQHVGVLSLDLLCEAESIPIVAAPFCRMTRDDPLASTSVLMRNQCAKSLQCLTRFPLPMIVLLERET